MRKKQRQPLALFLILTQIGCLTFGVVWSARWLHRTFDQVVDRNAASLGQSLALDLARRADELPLDSIEPGSAGWAQLQELCRQTKVPNDGFVAVMRSDTGALTCHSRLEADPTLLAWFPGRAELVVDDRATPVLQAVQSASAAAQYVVSGSVETDGALYELTCVAVPKLNAVVGVYQSGECLGVVVADLVNPLINASFLLVASVVGGTSLFTMFLVRRFEQQVDEVHNSLDQEVQSRTQSLVKTRNAVIFGLAKLAESRDNDTGNHLERVRCYVTLLAGEMAKSNPTITGHYVANLAVASSLHDIGKVGVPDAILLKPGKLTPSERQAMQMHAELGGECLGAIQRQLGEDGFLEVAFQVAMFHHEQWDGSGYPHGLQGRDIPLPARIVALADVYDALTTDRPYRPAMSHAEAREWIVTHYGTQFDPEVVEAFVAREKDFVRLGQSLRPGSVSDGGEKGEAAATAVGRPQGMALVMHCMAPATTHSQAAFRTVLSVDANEQEVVAGLAAMHEFRSLAAAPESEDAASKARTMLIHALINHNDFVTIR